MSDNNRTKDKRELHEPRGAKEPKDSMAMQKKLLETSSELRLALNSWDELCKSAVKPSADEQMLLEIKGLLSKLKNQIEDFK